ncbi:MAG: 30S ribosomal protein S6 [bacterium]
MKTYELLLILPGTFDDSSATRFIKDLENTLVKFNAKINDLQLKGKQQLAYSIKDKKSSFQIVAKITAEPKDIAAIKVRLKLVEDLLRFEIFNLPEVVVS